MAVVHRRLADRGRIRRADRAVLVMAADGGLEFLEAAVGGHRRAVLDALWETVPTIMRSAQLSLRELPEEYSSAFAWSRMHGFTIDLSLLPQTLRRELAWCMFRTIERGGKITFANMAMFARWLGMIVADSDAAALCSLMDLSPREWLRRFSLAMQRYRGRLPAVSTVQNFRQHLLGCYRLLWNAYDPRPWWQHEVWDPAIDSRIVLRAHEPCGRRAAHFEGIATGWLRTGLQWHCRVSLETGAMTWTTALGRISGLKVFDQFCQDRRLGSPRLAGSPAQVRTLMLDYLGHVRGKVVSTNRSTRGQPLSPSRLIGLMAHPEQFYAFMHDNRDAAAVALGEPEWRMLGTEHLVFFRSGERPRRQPRPAAELDVIDDAAFSQIMSGLGVLGVPVSESGLGDEQAMRILMLLALTGRRLNEICMLDLDPLQALTTPASTSEDPDVFVARLRYQQTKIEGSPDTILVNAEVVTIIKAQQEWAARHFASHGAVGRVPRYLFLAVKMNRNGDLPYSGQHLRDRLNALVQRLDIRDAMGRVVDFNRTHRFRHTKGTSLLNAGVPLHVVQRYLGHLSPTMTMHYAQTLAATHEAEFLRYRKVTSDARDLGVDPEDLYDMLQLDKRTDRILPNGFCLLPPRQSCDRGNACLTCDKFATDATFLPELTTQRDRTLQLIDDRQQAFCARTGAPMSEDNVWLQGRRREAAALEAITTVLRADPGPAGTAHGGEQRPHAVRGAGVAARTAQAAARAPARTAAAKERT
jgi:integrase